MILPVRKQLTLYPAPKHHRMMLKLIKRKVSINRLCHLIGMLQVRRQRHNVTTPSAPQSHNRAAELFAVFLAEIWMTCPSAVTISSPATAVARLQL